MTLSTNSRVVVTKNHVSCELEGEGVILNLDDGVYYGLNEVGWAVLELIQKPTFVSQVRDEIVRQFEVEPENCEKDILGLLAQLEKASLVQLLPSSEEN